MIVGHLLYLEIVGLVTVNFSIKVQCPAPILSFDEASNILALTRVCRQQYI